MPLILGTNSIKDTGYDVANSLRFDSPSSDNLTRSQSSGNRRTFTFSAWLKVVDPAISSAQIIMENYADSGNYFIFYINNNPNEFSFFDYSSSATQLQFNASQEIRDPSAWYHVVVAIDTTQSTESNRVKFYINGSQVTAFDTASYPSQNLQTNVNNGNNHMIGRWGSQSGYGFNGYMAEVVFIDGQALDPTSFGEFDSDTPTVWKPIDVSGLTFGTNGYYLDFEDSSALGNDVAGSNNFTVNNLATTDQSTDTCTNNFATLNPLKRLGTTSTQFQKGNLQYSTTTTAWGNTSSTLAFTKGKWYAEAKIITLASSTGYGSVGISDINLSDYNGDDTVIKQDAETAGVALDHRSGQSDIRSGTSLVTSNIGNFSANDIVGLAVDMDNKALYIHLNGTYYQISSVTGVPTSGASKTGAITIPASVVDCAFHVGSYTDKSETAFNFGSPFYSISSGNSDANGYGNFEYSVPSGYYSLNTKNLAEFG